MNLIILGPPGAGKVLKQLSLRRKKHSAYLYRRYVTRSIKNGTELGLQAKAVMDAGNLVSDDLSSNWSKRGFHKTIVRRFLFDGFLGPYLKRSSKENNVDINGVIELVIADEEIIKRMSGRRIHLASGRTYHVDFNPPKKLDWMMKRARNLSLEKMMSQKQSKTV